MIKAYYKLVRDKIPQIIKSRGTHYTTKTLNSKEFGYYLKLKLKEEIIELTNTKTQKEKINEIADIYEILDYLIKYYKIKPEEIKKCQKQKRSKNGGFDKRIFLVLTEE